MLARVRDLDPDLFARIGAAWRVGPDVVLEVEGRRLWFGAQVSAEDIRAVMAVEQALARQRAAISGARWTLRRPGDRPPGARMSAQPQRLVAALDLGSTKVVAVIAEVTGDARDAGAKILGVGVGAEHRHPARRGPRHRGDHPGHRQGDEERPADGGRRGGLGLLRHRRRARGGAQLARHGVSVTGDEIRTSDVARVNDMASNISFGRDHELLHAIPQDYLIDQQGGINEPIGMTGSRLEAEVYLVTVLSSVLQNLRKCVERAGYHVAGVRAGAAGGLAGGAHAGRDRAGLRHRRAGRRIDQRVDLPQREDPAHRLAALRRRPRHRATSCTACR